jgi:type I restriction enzyme R subunit
MNKSDTSEKGLEALIVAHLTADKTAGVKTAGERQGDYFAAAPGYVQGDPADFDRDHAIDGAQLLHFLRTTQPHVVERLRLDDDIARRGFLHRLQGELAKRGVVDVLRKGVSHQSDAVELFYGTPTPGNPQAAARFQQNIFSITRQVRYSKDERRLALDLCIFINGLPFATFELKNSLTKQTYSDAIEQYKRDRDPKELLFQFGRCAVHFAVDDQQVWMCTHLQGKQSWFLPFNKGFNDGAGNPPNAHGLATAYLWEEVLQPRSLTNILENYAQIVEEPGNTGQRKRRKQVFPRYHQLDVVRKLLADAQQHGAGQRYLIQHSAGSGKSNSITWLAHQLVELKTGQVAWEPSNRVSRRNSVAESAAQAPVFDSVIVVTDRRNLDKQIRDNIKRFAQVSAVVGAVTEGSAQLRQFLQDGKKIIISTVQKFPFILDALGDQAHGRRFAIIIDEAHSSQGGRTTAAMNIALTGNDAEEEASVEEIINHLMETRRMLPNASYFAFTATPKNKTLELFGAPVCEGESIQHHPFHSYTMKQAIQEGFILDVLASYTPVASYYRLIKTVEDDPEFDVKKAQRKLRRYVEGNAHAIREKVEIMVDHFHDQVLARQKLGGQARAMIVTGGIRHAIETYDAVQAYLLARKSPYRALVAFSGESEYKGRKVTEAALNGFASALIPERFQTDPYRFLIVADKFQTGYDEPLLHTMYVDKVLDGVKAVQTLSRLNRAHPQKRDTFVLDFANDADTIQAAFAPYYRTTILSGETDPNKLHDLKADLDGYQVYAGEDVELLVERYLRGADRDQLDPILDRGVATYQVDLDEEGQVAFKGKAKAFVRTYNFLAAVLPYTNAAWEKLAIFLTFLTPKLPAPVETDLAKGILETIDMESYRVEVQATRALALTDADGVIDPVPVGDAGRLPEPELDLLSSIVRAFNEQWGNIDWKDSDKIHRLITEEIPAAVALDTAYANARKNADRATARIEHDQALQRVMLNFLTVQTELFREFSNNPGFKKWLADMSFMLTYEQTERAG